MSYDVNPERDDANYEIAALQEQVATLQEQIRQLEANPPAGACASVHEFSAKGWGLLRNLLDRLPGGTLVPQTQADALNTLLTENKGIKAYLMHPATGGTTPPLLNIEDVLQALKSEGRNYLPSHKARAALRELAGAELFRIDPVHPNPPATVQAQQIANKLLDRPELAEEVFRLLMVGL